ncbi:succinate dehydrogenase, cytochrome b556 subunit [Sphingomonas sp. CFBP 13720]|uniref:succinate dehydrogenase, cytochrome b556 subunit n=1 Tax=Sphingomonas sp. CFBP 13720 TaxID=2775302 RepID=UPI0017829F74|nr:succinate dehydrogenase, cytochrome b556 subunit [Sphingomonas sp. CFBP 13720]MBD8678489.1 succinate dehydrogenase, cytochrome b556 subunit [Sphingomonas sp. CFBP 13720]
MASVRPKSRPLSPHLQIWRWGPHMLVSILHRATGVAMGTVGLALLAWWLAAIAGGEDSYARFLSWFTGEWAPLGYLFGIGFTYVLFQHMGTGMRHFVLDVGAGYELRRNRRGAIGTIVFAVIATIALWTWLLVGKA